MRYFWITVGLTAGAALVYLFSPAGAGTRRKLQALFRGYRQKASDLTAQSKDLVETSQRAARATQEALARGMELAEKTREVTETARRPVTGETVTP